MIDAVPGALAMAGLLLGALVGSFLNVVAHRLPLMMERAWREECQDVLDTPADESGGAAAEPFDLLRPRSHCPACQRPVRPRENIPLVSYLLLRGRCAGCGTRISVRYPAVEAITALLSLVVVLEFGFSLQAGAALLFTWALVAASAIDLDHRLLPDSITLPLMWLGLLVSVNGTFVPPATAILGAAAGYGVLWLVFQLFRLATGKEGMGYGDFKLLAAIGAWVGWQGLPVVILLSSVVGSVVGVVLIATLGRGRDYQIPFGPYLAAAGWIGLLWGGDLLNAYLAYSGLD